MSLLDGIPAGKGAESVFLMKTSYGDLGIWYRGDDGGAGMVAEVRGIGISGPDAVMAALAAVLPVIGPLPTREDSIP